MKIFNQNLFKTIIFLALTVPPVMAGNAGHRGGADVYHNLPENSISVLKAALETGINGEAPLQFRKDFKYLEFDVYETYDNHLVIFHDRTISRMLPNYGVNRDVIKSLIDDGTLQKRMKKRKVKYKKIRIKHLTLAELKLLRLKGTENETVPTLTQWLEAAAKYGLVKPIVFELKYFQSTEAKKRLIEKAAQFREDYMDHQDLIIEKGFDFPETTAFLAFSRKMKKGFGKNKSQRRAWCRFFKENGFKGVFKAGKHSKNFCKKYM